jgi:hypothetical protein
MGSIVSAQGEINYGLATTWEGRATALRAKQKLSSKSLRSKNLKTLKLEPDSLGRTRFREK